MSTSITLRKLPWPELPRVDLTREFHWIIQSDGSTPDGEPDLPAEDQEQEEDFDDVQAEHTDQFQCYCAALSDLAHSPYKKVLQHPKKTRLLLSPAQRAAKRILKLKLELGCLEDDSTTFDCYSQQLTIGSDGVRIWDSSRQTQENRTKPISTISHTPASKFASRGQMTASTSKPSAISTGSTSPATSVKKKELHIAKPPAQARDDAVAMVASRGPAISSLSSRPLSSQSQPSTKTKKKRPETKEQRELRELHEKQKRLADWLTSNTSSSKEKGNDGDAVAYSIEVESRIHHAMESTKDRGLWGDPVASLIASEMTSESVFGGFIPTRRLAFPPAATDPKSTVDPDKQPALFESQDRLEELIETGDGNGRIESPVHESTNSSSLIHVRALEIRQEARQLVQVGNVEDALATLQDGIKQLLVDFQDNQDEIQAQGFNFSQDAHSKATAVQLNYKARHRKRVAKIAFLQRIWRNYQVKKRFFDAKRFKAENARVIQRHYKQRFFRVQRTRAAVRIQTCFRIFQEQKLWVCLRKACRMLVNDERKKREKIRKYQAMKKRLWGKLTAALRMLWLWKSRFRAFVRIQKHWRSSRARVEYAKLLSAQCEVEKVRLSRELAFVKPRLDHAMALYHQFLKNTRVGKQLVHWQMEKPWLRFKRLRHEHGNWLALDLKTKVQALFGLLLKNRLRARQLRVFAHLLGVEASQGNKIRHDMNGVSVESLLALYEGLLPTFAAAADTADGATPVLPNPSKSARCKRWLNKRKVTWKNICQTWKLSLSRQLLLLYWRLVLWPLNFVVARNSLQNRHRAIDLLEQQQRFALTKHLRLAYRQLDPNGRGNRPNFACEYCSEPFATAHACNLHLRTCKQRRSEQLLEWEAIHQDIAFLEAQQASSQPSSRLLLISKTPQECLDFATFQLKPDFVKQLLPGTSEKWWSSNRKALRMLVDMAVCCGVDDLSGRGLQGRRVALELVAFLLLSLLITSSMSLEHLHALALPQLHALVDWTPMETPDPSVKNQAIAASQWISEKELLAKLCLSQPTQFVWSSWSVGRFMEIATRAVSCWWQRAKTKWARSSRSASNYHQRDPQASSASATVLPVA